MSNDTFNLEELRAGLKPFRLYWFPRLRSTNDHAASLRKRGRLFAPAIVLTGHQTAGRGRNTNTWWSSSGSLTVTFVLPIDEHLAPHQIPLIAGLAVRDAIARAIGFDDVQLKWPNDLLYEGRKLAGLLCERVQKADLIGLGVNVNQTKPAPRALARRIVSLSEIGGHPMGKNELLLAIAKELYPVLTHRREHPFARVLREYDRHHALLGKRLTITNSTEPRSLKGTCQGLDSMGRLLLRTSTGQTHRIIAGQVDMD